jgi:predicted DNA-binding transcriptional regulator AlpA
MDHSVETGTLEMLFPHMPDVLTARELETFINIDVKTIYGYVQRGIIPYVRIQSNLRFLKHQILQWLAEHNFQP